MPRKNSKRYPNSERQLGDAGVRTQDEVAKMLRLSRSTVSRIEIEAVRKIAAALHRGVGV